VRVVVVGGGIAGLVTAYRLLRSTAALNISVTLLEAAPRAGGRIATSRFDGFVVEHGADSFLATRPHGHALAHELGLAGELQPARHWRHRAFIRRGGRMHPLPAGLSGLVPGSAPAWLRAAMIGWPGRLRAAAERWIPARIPAGDESIAAFARRRFGRQAYDWLIEPLLAGIHGGDGESLSVRATFPVLVGAETQYGSVTRGLHARAGPATANTTVPKTRARTAAPFLTPRDGMERWIDALLDRLGGCDLRTSTAAIAIDRGAPAQPAWTVHARTAGGLLTLAADALVLAIPAHAAARLVTDTAPGLAAQLASIPFATTTIVQAAFAADAVRVPLEGGGHLNPRVTGRPVSACTWTSSKFEHRAPAGAVLLRAFLKGDAASAGDDAVIRHALDEFRDALGIDAAPLWLRVDRHAQGMPQYTLGHQARVSAVHRALDLLPGLFVAGHSYHGVGIPDTIGSATLAAAALLSFAGYPGAGAAIDATAPGRATREVDAWNG